MVSDSLIPCTMRERTNILCCSLSHCSRLAKTLGYCSGTFISKSRCVSELHLICGYVESLLIAGLFIHS